MTLFNCCYLCFRPKHNIENMLCDACVVVFDDYKFYSCPRCTKLDCSGCIQLSEFQSIFCLYTYNALTSKVIATAKDKFNMNFQKMFEEMFYAPVKAELEKILEHKNYDTILLAPYRKARLFHGYWHPNIFFEKIVSELKTQFQYSFKVITTHYTSKKLTSVFWQPEVSNTGNPSILLCDDVLTTGTSALTCFRALQHKRLENARWDLFVLFRSPQK